MNTLTGLGPGDELAGAVDEEPDDHILLDGFLDNDEASFPAIYNRYRKQLTGYARRHLIAPVADEADDIVQHSFTEFIRRRNEKTLDPQTHLRGLLHRMVEFHCSDRNRQVTGRNRKHPHTYSLSSASPALRAELPCGNEQYLAGNDREDSELVDPKADPSHWDNDLILRELLEALPPKEARAIRLCRIEGHTTAAAAEIMGETHHNVKWWVQDGMERLKRLARK